MNAGNSAAPVPAVIKKPLEGQKMEALSQTAMNKFSGDQKVDLLNIWTDKLLKSQRSRTLNSAQYNKIFREGIELHWLQVTTTIEPNLKQNCRTNLLRRHGPDYLLSS